MSEIYVNSNIFTSILDICATYEIKFNQQFNIIFKQQWNWNILKIIRLFLILYRWDCFLFVKKCGRYDLLRDKLLVLNSWAFFVGIKKCFDLVQILCITYEIRRKVSKWLLMRDMGWKTIFIRDYVDNVKMKIQFVHS